MHLITLNPSVGILIPDLIIPRELLDVDAHVLHADLKHLVAEGLTLHQPAWVNAAARVKVRKPKDMKKK